VSINKLSAELLGTYVLVLGGTATILSAAAGGAPSNILIVAFGFGLALMAGLYAFGEVSGGHFNPAVSLAMVLDKRLDPMSMAGYWVASGRTSGCIGSLRSSVPLSAGVSTSS
jgi:aquaporin Z